MDLWGAASRGNEPRVRTLLAEDQPQRELDSGLRTAAEYGHIAIAVLLLDAGADVNYGGGWPLRHASRGGHSEIVTLLLERGADVNRTLESGYTALMVAAWKGRTTVVTQLIEAGADVHTTDEGGKTAMHYAAECGHANVIPILAAAGANVDQVDDDGNTPLMWTAMCANAQEALAATQALLQLRANADLVNQVDETAVMMAAQEGKLDMLRAILDSYLVDYDDPRAANHVAELRRLEQLENQTQAATPSKRQRTE